MWFNVGDSFLELHVIWDLMLVTKDEKDEFAWRNVTWSTTGKLFFQICCVNNWKIQLHRIIYSPGLKHKITFLSPLAVSGPERKSFAHTLGDTWCGKNWITMIQVLKLVVPAACSRRFVKLRKYSVTFSMRAKLKRENAIILWKYERQKCWK